MSNTTTNLSGGILASFRTWLADSDLRKNTLLSYNFRIDAYLNFQRAQSSHLLPEVSQKSAVRYLEHLRKEQASASTYNVTIAALSKFFEFFGEDFTPLQRIYSGNTKKTSLTAEETRIFLDASLKHGSLKARVIALLCFHGDFSASQCLELDKVDIIVDSGRCLVNARKRGELVEIHGGTKELIVSWHSYASREDNLLQEALFLSEHGSRISRSGIDYLIKSVGIPARLLLSARVLQNTGRAYRQEFAVRANFSASKSERLDTGIREANQATVYGDSSLCPISR